MFKNVTYMATQDLSQFREANIKVVKGLTPRQMFQVLEYDFTTERSLNEKGVPYNSRVKAVLHLTVEVNKHGSSAFFYDALSSRSQQTCSILFCQGTSLGTLKCIDAAVLDGFITNVQEQYITKDGDATLNLKVEVLVRSFKFAEEIVGNNAIPFHLLKFTND